MEKFLDSGWPREVQFQGHKGQKEMKQQRITFFFCNWITFLSSILQLVMAWYFGQTGKISICEFSITSYSTRPLYSCRFDCLRQTHS